MSSKVLIKRIAALMLTAVMTLSMSCFAFEDVFADSSDAGLTTEASSDAALTSADDGEDAAKADAPESEGTEDGSDAAENQAVENQDTEGSKEGENTDPLAEAPETGDPAVSGDALAEELQEDQQTEAADDQEEITEENVTEGDVDSVSDDSLNAGSTPKYVSRVPAGLPKIGGLELTGFTAGDNNTVNAAVKWNEYESAARYEVSDSRSEDKTPVDVTEYTVIEYTVAGLSKGQDYVVTVIALDSDDKPLAGSECQVSTYVTGFKSTGSQENLSYTAGQAKYNNKIKLSWDVVPGADSYTVTKKVTAPDGSEIKDVQRKEGQQTIDIRAPAAGSKSSPLEATFENLYPGRKYTFTVTAKAGGTDLFESLPTNVKDVQPKLTALQGRTRGGRTLSPSKIKFANGDYDLRAYAGQVRNGWGVAQGGASDGTNAYVLLANSYKQTGRVAKYRISDSKMMKVSGTLQTTHGNGMTYDSRRHQLAVIGRNDSVRGNHKQEITIIDADTLTIVRQQNLNYSYFSNDSEFFDADQRSRGLAAIAYSPKYDVYVAKQRDLNNLIIIDPDTLKAIGLVKTLVNQYGGAGQAMDGDDQFVYMLKSGYGSSNTNIVLTLDWNGNRLIDATTGARREFVKEYWGCTNSLYPVAMYTIKTPHEAENVFHYFDNSGREIFYMTEYNANQQYNITKTQKAYKAKWKKVKKKVKVKKTKKVKKKVKWKKVKTKKGKYKWKYKKKKVKVTYYKWKKKKVWLYKTKYKTVTTKTPTYKDRKDYVYYLGIL